MKQTLSSRKSAQKADQGQQTPPMNESLGVVLMQPKSKSVSPKLSMSEAFQRYSPKSLTPEQRSTLYNRFRGAVRGAARGAAMLGLVDPPEDPKAKRKLLGADTPGGRA